MFIIWVKFVEIPKKNLKASLMSSTHSLISDKAHCFSQSVRALYGNFIIITRKESVHRIEDSKDGWLFNSGLVTGYLNICLIQANL